MEWLAQNRLVTPPLPPPQVLRHDEVHFVCHDRPE